MINKWLSMNPGMPFRKKVVLKIWASVLLILLGAFAVCALIYTNSLGVEQHSESFRSGFYTGTGLGLVFSGIITIVQCVRLLKNAEKFRVAEISDSDERRRFIYAQGSMWTIFFMFVLLFAGTVVAGIYSNIVFVTLLWTLGAFGSIVLICHIVARNMY